MWDRNDPLLKPLSYYQEKYGSVLHGFNQLFLLMEKQHNRGQDGAGIGCVKLDVAPGALTWPVTFHQKQPHGPYLSGAIKSL